MWGTGMKEPVPAAFHRSIPLSNIPLTQLRLPVGTAERRRSRAEAQRRRGIPPRSCVSVRVPERRTGLAWPRGVARRIRCRPVETAFRDPGSTPLPTANKQAGPGARMPTARAWVPHAGRCRRRHEPNQLPTASPLMFSCPAVVAVLDRRLISATAPRSNRGRKSPIPRGM
jgi:hypothetical protein